MREIMRMAICDDSTEIVEQIESYIDKIQEMHIEYEVFFSVWLIRTNCPVIIVDSAISG